MTGDARVRVRPGLPGQIPADAVQPVEGCYKKAFSMLDSVFKGYAAALDVGLRHMFRNGGRFSNPLGHDAPAQDQSGTQGNCNGSDIPLHRS